MGSLWDYTYAIGCIGLNPLSLPPSPSSAERQAAAAGRCSRVNKLVRVSVPDDSEDEPELTQAIQEVCGAANAFILVVDPSKMDI